MSYDPKLSVKENLAKAVETELKGTERVMSILTNARKRYKELDVLGEKVKIRPSIPKAVRHFAEELKDDPSQQTVSGVETSTYKILAYMCTEDPYDKPEFWKILDDETGEAVDVLQRMYTTAADTEAEIKTFRGK